MNIMPKIQLSSLAVLLLGSLLPLAESARVVESQLKAELDKHEVASHSDVKTLKKASDIDGKKENSWPFSNSADRPKICCCELPNRCYWQSKISFDTGSGCNVVGMLNPWAKKQHISGITDQTRVDRRSGAEDPAKNLLFFNPTIAAKQAEYGQLCESLNGAMIRLKDVDGKDSHQYIVDIEHFAASTVVVHEDSSAVETPAPEETQAEDKKQMAATVEDIKVKVTSRLLKKYMRESPPNKALCSLACDMWPPVKMGNKGKKAKAKTGCHSPLSSGFNSNARNYCKKVCQPKDKCQG